MDILVGCSSGVNKIYNIHKKLPTGLYGSLNTQLDLNVMTYGWENNENNEDYVFYGYSNGNLKYWNQKEKQLIGELNYNQSIKAIHTLSNDKLLVALESGLVDIKTFTSPTTNSLTAMNLPTLNKKKQSAAATKKGVADIVAEPVNTQSFSLNVSSNIMGFAMNESKDKFALGGKDVNLTIWDLERQVKTYTAKYKHDFLNLQEPVSVNDIKYMSDDKIVVGSGFKLKAYDLRSKTNRSSFMDVSFSKHPIQAVQYTSQKEHYFYASDSIGKVFCYDIRTQKHVGSFKDSTGSVRDIAIHPTLPLLATVGLDRFLRVYNLDNRKMLHKIFLKQRLSCCLFSKDIPTIEINQEDEELWDNLDKNIHKVKSENGEKKTVSIKVTDNMDSDDELGDEDSDDDDMGDLDQVDEDDSDFGLDGSEEDISEFQVKKQGKESDDDDSDSDDVKKSSKRKTPAKSNMKNNNKKGNNKKTSQILKKKLSGLKSRK